MTPILAANDLVCGSIVGWLLWLANAVESWRRAKRRGLIKLRGSIRRLMRDHLARRGTPTRIRYRSWNRTPVEVEEAIVRLHVSAPHVGAAQLRHLAQRVLGISLARETVRRILLRRQDLVEAMTGERRTRPTRIRVSASKSLWGIDLTLMWVLGVAPVWVIGIVDYHGSRLLALEPLAAATAAEVVRVLEHTITAHGTPVRVLTDRGSVFRAANFRLTLAERGVAHTMTRTARPWTNGRVERLFRSFKEIIGAHYWMVSSRRHLRAICSDFQELYNAHRPHQAYGGLTPDEVAHGRPRSSELGPLRLFDGRLRWWRFS